MARRLLLRGGLRAELALAIAIVTAIGVGASFLALYGGTGSRLRAQLDAQLRTQAAEWRQATAGADLSTAQSLQHAAQRFISAQRYHAEALIIALQIDRGRTVTNDPELLMREEAREHSPHEVRGLLDAPTGLSTAVVAEAGNMRVLTVPIDYQGRRVGTLRVADPLTPVEQAQASLRRTFLVVGVLALVLAVAVGMGLAALIAAPLRRMARVAAAAEGGDLSVRAGPVRAQGEVAVLSEALDHMLERVERAFKRQRDFVSDASHELRTPLAVLRAQVELLDRETDEARRHEGAATLVRRLDELDRLVGDMLTLASAEGGQLIEPHPIDLSEFFEDLRRDLPLFGERDFLVEPVAGTLNADPDRLTQVLRNLGAGFGGHDAVAGLPRDDRVLGYGVDVHHRERQPGREERRDRDAKDRAVARWFPSHSRATSVPVRPGSGARARAGRRPLAAGCGYGSGGRLRSLPRGTERSRRPRS